MFNDHDILNCNIADELWGNSIGQHACSYHVMPSEKYTVYHYKGKPVASGFSRSPGYEENGISLFNNKQ